MFRGNSRFLICLGHNLEFMARWASSMRPMSDARFIEQILKVRCEFMSIEVVSIAWVSRASWATCCEVIVWFRAISLMWDARFTVSLNEQTKERIGERTLELWGDLFVSVYGKRCKLVSELVSELTIGASMMRPIYVISPWMNRSSSNIMSSDGR